MMTTPIERAAEVIGASRVMINGRFQDTPEQVARAVFESIDVPGTARALASEGGGRAAALFDLGHENTVALYTRHATAVKAHLLSEGGE
jgi:hypothetical protein